MIFYEKSPSLIYLYQPAALIEVSGEDVFSFLQGQFTNELRHPVGCVTYGLWLNQKGKVLADSHIARIGENKFLLTSTGSPAAVIAGRLGQYVIADDVVLRDETHLARGLSVWGKQSAELIKNLFGEVPLPGKFLSVNETVVFPGRRSEGDNYEIIGLGSDLAEFRERLIGQGAIEASANDVEFSRISASIPAVPQDIGPLDLPNEGGLESNAISFTKGCYLGQEVMARLKNLGQVRRQLRRVRGTGAPPVGGTALFQAGKKIGEIRSAASEGGEFIALAMLTRMGLDEKAGFDFQSTNEAAQKPLVWMS